MEIIPTVIKLIIHTLRPPFFRWIFFNENVSILIKFSLFLGDRVTAWRRISEKPLSHYMNQCWMLTTFTDAHMRHPNMRHPMEMDQYQWLLIMIVGYNNLSVSLCLSVCLCLCLSLSLSQYLSLSLSLSLSLYIYIYIWCICICRVLGITF